ncbi:protein KHNYN-like [Protopterus annectens]|uniref:protein KHNYN-like n=1 Tax=Protopterus annectens TaxID=7888 RepID=UPI001CFB501A|nr:protein KHNYN-like [Protopterus annectens]
MEDGATLGVLIKGSIQVLPLRRKKTGDTNSLTVVEFAVPQENEKALWEMRPQIQNLFGVKLEVHGVLSGPNKSPKIKDQQQTWLQLEGPVEDLKKAKEYIIGLCTPELEQVVTYPKDLHCIFTRAKGLFLSCLILGTSAGIIVQGNGVLRILGKTESVVMAHSQILELVTKYEKNIRVSEEHELEIKRRFKILVETFEDKHFADLLILPSSVKNDLLTLVQEFYVIPLTDIGVSEVLKQNGEPLLVQNRNQACLPSVPMPYNISTSPQRVPGGQILHTRDSKPRPASPLIQKNFREPSQNAEDEDSWSCAASKDLSHLGDVAVANWLAKGTNIRTVPEPCSELTKHGAAGSLCGLESKESGHECSAMSSYTEKEYRMLLNFFKTMGYKEDIIKKVLAESGLQEPSAILDRVQMEQQTLNLEESPKTRGNEESNFNMAATVDTDEDFMLAILKVAGEKCGYTAIEISETCKGLLAHPHEMLKQLNERRKRSEKAAEVSDISQAEQLQMERLHFRPSQPGTFNELHKQERESSPYCHNHRSSSPSKVNLRGPPQQNYAHTADRLFSEMEPAVEQPECQKPLALSDTYRDSVSAANTSNSLPKEHSHLGGQDKVQNQNTMVTVTGAQRFLDAMQTPYSLTLANEGGKDNLRHVIIDGSNVAMTHGLSKFFSCRGIALAVEYFWNRGHRNVTVFVPSYRKKKDDKIKEQELLQQLTELGLLSFTPSRTVQGKTIASYDDRFLLQLAEQTDGVIVTNDNLKDLVDESPKWKNIIKERILQYTFVGDIFMVPDDPLGRNGPFLDEFLSQTKRALPAACHSFAGRGTPIQPSHPNSQTEVLNYRDRRPGRRSVNETERLRGELLNIFTDQDIKVDFVLQKYPTLTDLCMLSDLILGLQF